MARVLFINPPSRADVYLSTNVSTGAPFYPDLTIATLAGNLTGKHEVKVVDLDLVANHYSSLFDTIKDFSSDIIASSANTTEYYAVRDMMRKIKRRYPNITTIVGGVHITALPQEAGSEECFDIISLGEGDTVISEILSASSLKDIPGIIYRDTLSGSRIQTPARKLIDDLNVLPYPVWNLFGLKHYRHSRITSRKNPVGLIETSRGCAFQCSFCSKLTFGSRFRAKEPKRVVDEMEYMLGCGFREIHIADDSFTQDIIRAKEVCAEILRRNLRFPWSLINGIRVDMIDFEFLKLANRKNLYSLHRVYSGFYTLSENKYDVPESIDYILMNAMDEFTFETFKTQDSSKNIRSLVEKGDYGLVEAIDNLALFKRNYKSHKKLYRIISKLSPISNKDKILSGKIFDSENNLAGQIDLIDIDTKQEADNIIDVEFTWKCIKEANLDLGVVLYFYDSLKDLAHIETHPIGYRIYPASAWVKDGIIRENFRALVPWGGFTELARIDIIDLSSRERISSKLLVNNSGK